MPCGRAVHPILALLDSAVRWSIFPRSFECIQPEERIQILKYQADLVAFAIIWLDLPHHRKGKVSRGNWNDHEYVPCSDIVRLAIYWSALPRWDSCWHLFHVSRWPDRAKGNRGKESIQRDDRRHWKVERDATCQHWIPLISSFYRLLDGRRISEWRKCWTYRLQELVGVREAPVHEYPVYICLVLKEFALQFKRKIRVPSPLSFKWFLLHASCPRARSCSALVK